MIGLDTNVLVRYLVGDDARQSAVAREVMAGANETVTFDRKAALEGHMRLLAGIPARA